MYGISGNNLLRFDTASPTVINSTTPITNITAGETIVGIDFRPQNGLLYGLGVNATVNNATLYAISVRTGFAGVVGSASSIASRTSCSGRFAPKPDIGGRTEFGVRAEAKPEFSAFTKLTLSRSTIDLPTGPFPQDRDRNLLFGITIGLPVFDRKQGAKAEAAIAIRQAQERRTFAEGVITRPRVLYN